MKLHINWQALGATAAIACAIHCAILPLLLTSLPLLGVSFLNNPVVDIGLLLTAIVIGGISLWHGFKRHHHRILPSLLFIIGMSLLVLIHFTETKNLLLVFPASFLIIFAYYFNWKFCRIAKHCHAADCAH